MSVGMTVSLGILAIIVLFFLGVVLLCNNCEKKQERGDYEEER